VDVKSYILIMLA